MSTPRRWEIDDAVARRLAAASDLVGTSRKSQRRRGGFVVGGAAIILVGLWAAGALDGFLSSQGSVGAGMLPAGDGAISGESHMSNKSSHIAHVANIAASAAVAFAAVSFSPELDVSCAQGTGACEGDVNGDGAINGIDLSYVLTNWGQCAPPPPPPLSWATTLEALPDPAVVTDAALRQKIIDTNLPWRVRDNASNIEMLLVPPGTFMMGCSAGDSECFPNESPAHQVTLTQSFYLGKLEVTQAQYGGGSSTIPKVLSWNSAQAFCVAKGLRLPTSAEWEFACRAGTTTARYGATTDIAWYNTNSGGTLHAVATKAPNAFGFYDMLGNAYEFCSTYTYAYSSQSVVDPQGPPTGTYHVVRGGAYEHPVSYSRASSYEGANSTQLEIHLGFRVARNP